MLVSLPLWSRFTLLVSFLCWSNVFWAQGSPSGQLELQAQFVNPCGLDGHNEFLTLATSNAQVNINDMAFASINPTSMGTQPNLNFYWRGKNVAQSPYPTLTLRNENCGTAGLHCYGIADPGVSAEAMVINDRINALNTTAGCTVFLAVPSDGNIPPNSNVILFLGAYICDFINISANLNFSNHCSTGATYYAVFGFGDGGSPGCGSNLSGYFSNSQERTSVSYVYTGVDNTDPANYQTNSVNYTPGADPASGNAGFIGRNGSWINDQSCIPSSSVLPITLLHFYGVAKQTNIILHWATATEKDNAYMSVERSRDGIHFQEIGQVTGAGTTSSAQLYDFTDWKPFTGINYYRLKQVDHDNNYEYHKTIAVEFDKKAIQNDFIIYPTLAKEECTVFFESPLPEKSELIVLDLTGRIIKRLTVTQEDRQKTIPVNDLISGTYLVTIQSSRMWQTARFVKF